MDSNQYEQVMATFDELDAVFDEVLALPPPTLMTRLDPDAQVCASTGSKTMTSRVPLRLT